MTLSEEAIAKGVYFAHDSTDFLWCVGQCGDDEAAYESAIDLIGDMVCTVINPMALDSIPESQHGRARVMLAMYSNME